MSTTLLIPIVHPGFLYMQLSEAIAPQGHEEFAAGGSHEANLRATVALADACRPEQ